MTSVIGEQPVEDSSPENIEEVAANYSDETLEIAPEIVEEAIQADRIHHEDHEEIVRLMQTDGKGIESGVTKSPRTDKITVKTAVGSGKRKGRPRKKPPLPSKVWAWTYRRRLVRQNAFLGTWPEN